MICPQCSHPVMSFTRFLLKAYPKNLTCSHCGAKLTWSAQWREVFRASLVIAAICAVILAIFRHAVGISLLGYIAIFVVAVLIFDAYFWSRSIYEKTAEAKS